MSKNFGELAGRVGADGAITAEDILALRREAWPDGKISTEEAEAIFALNHQLREKPAEWVDFFVEALGEYIVNQRPPVGYVDGENADWLIAHIDADGQLGSMAEVELLVRVFERAQNVPGALKDFAIARIERAVLDGTGPTRDGGELEAGNVNATEARLLRRAVFAPASERPAAVGRGEAEMLFRLKDKTLGAENAPEWKRLFVQGVANYLQGFVGKNAQVSRERAQELESFFDDSSSKVGGFMGRVLKTSSGDLANVFGRRDAGSAHHEAVAAAREVTEVEQSWLDARIHADGEIDAYEQALLDFLAEE